MGIRDFLHSRHKKAAMDEGSSSSPGVLTEEEKEQFRTDGYVHLRSCFTPAQAQAVIQDVWTRLGMDPDDKATWTAMWTNMPHHRTFDAAEFAPRAWAAICELCGGEDRVSPYSREWRDSLIVNLGAPDLEGVEIPPQRLEGWHVDGDFFVHYLDSPEQGLLVVPLFTDIVPGGGGTVICPDSIPRIARHLLDNPAGVSPGMAPRGHRDFGSEREGSWFRDAAASCGRFVEVAGRCGDVFLLHPLMLHTVSTNPRRLPRIITNPPVSLREPFVFDRADGNYTLVEQATLRALGRDRLEGWRITGPRELIVPGRIQAQEKMKEDELKRMEGRA
ncbi:hypothetical protein ESCO_003090 [Escovopsis weberi]|uniref:Uncharacterized protein n=1 Tax=Escovopsis weberi TaxID=150374 RepID=A0A0M8N1B3_ESCWE|nr:hypothetical protein ESCO_003090 [Escovopsis weberi]